VPGRPLGGDRRGLLPYAGRGLVLFAWCREQPRDVDCVRQSPSEDRVCGPTSVRRGGLALLLPGHYGVAGGGAIGSGRTSACVAALVSAA